MKTYILIPKLLLYKRINIVVFTMILLICTATILTYINVSDSIYSIILTPGIGILIIVLSSTWSISRRRLSIVNIIDNKMELHFISALFPDAIHPPKIIVLDISDIISIEFPKLFGNVILKTKQYDEYIGVPSKTWIEICDVLEQSNKNIVFHNLP